MATPSETVIIGHDVSTSRDLNWMTVAEFIREKAATQPRPGSLQKKIERALAGYRTLRLDLGAAGHFTVRRAPDIAATAVQFRTRLARIGVVAGKTLEQVFALWTEYSHRSEGQSALLSEFADWYADRLGGDRVALREAAA